jgi:3-oxoacyl-(acyl-carrier-protein) synthase
MEDGEEGIWPYDQGANGLCLGEGAGILVLEEKAHALARGAEIYAEVESYGIASGCASVDDWRWDASGLASAITLALARAGRTRGHRWRDRLRVRPSLPRPRGDGSPPQGVHRDG